MSPTHFGSSYFKLAYLSSPQKPAQNLLPWYSNSKPTYIFDSMMVRTYNFFFMKGDGSGQPVWPKTVR